MNEIETFIQSILGADVEQFVYEAGGYEWVGWKKLVDETNSFDSDAATKIVNASWRACHEKNVRLLAGPNVLKSAYVRDSVPVFAQVFALPQLPVLDVVELCDVGSHNAPGPFLQDADAGKHGEAVRKALGEMKELPRWKYVRRKLQGVMKIAPFEIQSADSAHLWAAFLAPISKPRAREIGKLVLEISSDVLDVMESEMGIEMKDDGDAMPDYEAAMGDWITAMGGFKLWWD